MSTQKLVGENALSAIATDIKTALGAKANASDLATVATSGSYNDLSNKPSIPTKVSDLTNDSDFQTGDEVDASIATAITNKADIDGEYDLMVVGNAKQLKSNVGENDKVPYNFRTSGGSIDIGDREEDTIVGGSVAFNQLVGYFGTNQSSIETISTNKHKATSNGTKTYFGFSLKQTSSISIAPTINNIYFVSFNLTDISIDNVDNFTIGNGINSSFTASVGIKEKIIKAGSTNTTYLNASTNGTSLATDNFTVENVNIIDLTQMFGSTIADYIYTLESGTPGAGVAFFRKLFPKPYYAYNAGELISVKTSKHITRGFNAWDEKWELGAISDTTGIPYGNNDCIRSKNFIPVVPNTAYYYYCGAGNLYFRICYYDADKNFISSLAATQINRAYTTPINCHYIKIGMRDTYGTTYNNDICINLSWDGERDGEYEPYVSHEYALDSTKEWRGIFKLDANNKLYADGDRYPSDGQAERRFAIVDLGSLDWEATGSLNSHYTTLADAVNINGANSICDSFINYGYTQDWASLPAGYYTIRFNTLHINDNSGMTAAQFKTAMDGVYLIYELATPTAETAVAYINPQLVDDFGTEEYEDTRDIPVPVGHETFYQANLRAKLEMSPDSPSGNGDYIVRQTDGQNEYVALTKELPSLPSTDGTYTLKCTVSSGTASLSWVADE